MLEVESAGPSAAAPIWPLGLGLPPCEPAASRCSSDVSISPLARAHTSAAASTSSSTSPSRLSARGWRMGSALGSSMGGERPSTARRSREPEPPSSKYSNI
ncbi:hypothetical protein Vafri_11711 [Volvox africanus]|uniref:Uncharacterized protein n=1 Tax=Volvox africanus TaxID=51714 RepID=A0A8J4BD84_9CHLO|nr:hypothetical protein Vafri_11711 [Volvox africanus]